MSFYLLRPCDNSAAFELKPRKVAKLDLQRALEWLRQRKFREVVDAGVMVIVERECMVNLYPSGRMLLRTSDEKLAEKLAAEVGLLLNGAA
ncbi:MAG: hypothetical protein QF366_04185 [Candidatus Poseidoniia archaeon]|jgi:hypothetical protein|nr:hypothetical protein [Candidatus Poseidoniia archaeon]MDP6659031.1 hypothetical protein [Candidatus Poseidoniia archaeon]MDP6846818.1 hypothetical protein [Candidatus Poseidoniia archaeon]MDP7007050.1 hypothetical protein [Candidatus Poseidoniia archaeon]|tara:strand:- start:1641 stop:1913 length:273 start_codon:yes stop_codon:yes gene_type:complete